MLKRLELRCFRKHRELDIDFTAGLNALRGPNEAGKSTVIEGILYALYGSRALRDSLGDTVTEGCKEGELRAAVTIEVDGSTWTFSRSKAGAEAKGSGLMVTGQAEVTAHAASLLGADAKTAAQLMLAGQNELRGALEDGPTAVSALMGKLADFDVIDRLLGSAQQKLTLGSDALLQQRLATTQQTLAGLEQSKPDLAELGRVESMLLHQAGVRDAVQSEINETVQPAVDAAQDALDRVQDALKARDRAQARVEVAERALSDFRASLGHAERRAKPHHVTEERISYSCEQFPARLAELRAVLQAEQGRAAALTAWAAFKKLPAYPDVHWEGTKAEFDAALNEAGETLLAREKQVAALRMEVAGLEGQKITSGKCPTCGHAANSDEHVAEHNAGIEQRLVPLREQLSSVERERLIAKSELGDLQDLARDALKYTRLFAPFIGYVDQDEGFYPPKVSWRGDAPQELDTAGAKRELAELEAKQRAAEQAAGEARILKGNVDRAEIELLDAKRDLEMFPVLDAAPLQAAYDAAYERYVRGCERLRELEQNVKNLTESYQRAQIEKENHARQFADCTARLAELEQDLKDLGFNNALVKKLKAVRPRITDVLWNQVLSAVSTMFTEMRGTTSVVTKDADGFKVNGRKVSGLSGSTLDCLALAIRAALTLTFIPNTPFICLDEPAHGCDEDRTARMLGFIAACGFKQVVLATHDALSESLAQNVVTLGEGA